MEFDVIVIGGGHAGIEAALASSRLGHKTLMVCGNFSRIGNMPCNPSIGGPAKGILVREIDALGGEMGRAADATALQFKMLNLSKGPAVQALRVQSDKVAYGKYMQNVIKNTQNLEVHVSYVDELFVDSEKKVTGVRLEDGGIYNAKKIIIATGTFLASRILLGKEFHEGAPDGEPTNSNLSKSLMQHGFKLKRLKTGTPPRIKTTSIDFTKSKIEPGTSKVLTFSFDVDAKKNFIPLEKQIPCYLTYTTAKTHEIIKEHLNESSMYSGIVEGVGPRYCPSIEDKIVRFSDKEHHQIFLEPESLSLGETYIQGFSTSMPKYVQEMMVKSLPGFENAEIIKYAYAIEYDAINPLDLYPTLESKIIKGLYFAGQVNGTSGYEEAAAQGIIAGINSSLSLKGLEQIVLRRDEAYIGVLIDDLVTKGINDPYRMLTSRAEYRLLLRHDNADQRLMPYGYKVGLVSEDKYRNFEKKMTIVSETKDALKNLKITPKESVNKYLINKNSAILKDGIYANELLKRPEITYDDIVLMDISNSLKPQTPEISEQITIEVKYQGYIDKEIKDAQKLLLFENKKIPLDIDYNLIPNLASEAKEKLNKIRPLTISQAMRISGVNPVDISLILVYLEVFKSR